MGGGGASDDALIQAFYDFRQGVRRLPRARTPTNCSSCLTICATMCCPCLDSNLTTLTWAGSAWTPKRPCRKWLSAVGLRFKSSTSGSHPRNDVDNLEKQNRP